MREAAAADPEKCCFECRPPRHYDRAGGHHFTAIPAPPKPRYTWEEQAARADARGISYGRLVYLEENGLPLPPLKRSVRWPWDSPHRGEEQL